MIHLFFFWEVDNIVQPYTKSFKFSYESLEDTAQAIELYSQANSLAPSDPAILARLAAIYDAEGDKTQAFQSNYDVMEISLEIFSKID